MATAAAFPAVARAEYRKLNFYHSYQNAERYPSLLLRAKTSLTSSPFEAPASSTRRYQYLEHHSRPLASHNQLLHIIVVLSPLISAQIVASFHKLLDLLWWGDTNWIVQTSSDLSYLLIGIPLSSYVRHLGMCVREDCPQTCLWLLSRPRRDTTRKLLIIFRGQDYLVSSNEDDCGKTMCHQHQISLVICYRRLQSFTSNKSKRSHNKGLNCIKVTFIKSFSLYTIARLKLLIPSIKRTSL